jgi:hypothetical protein
MSEKTLGESWQLGPRAEPPLVMPLFGLLYPRSELALALEAAERFAEPYDGIALLGEPRPWDRTAYYAPEMGDALERRYCFCSRLVSADSASLVALKEWGYEIEQRYQRATVGDAAPQDLAGRVARRVNLDPGYLDYSKVVLASFKAGPQKLYCKSGIYADMVLYFSHGRFDPLPWTFPDLEGDTYGDLFVRARNAYKAALRRISRS